MNTKVSSRSNLAMGNGISTSNRMRTNQNFSKRREQNNKHSEKILSAFSFSRKVYRENILRLELCHPELGSGSRCRNGSTSLTILSLSKDEFGMTGIPICACYVNTSTISAVLKGKISVLQFCQRWKKLRKGEQKNVGGPNQRCSPRSFICRDPLPFLLQP